MLAELLKGAPVELREVLSLRQQLAKSSVRKYQAMENTVCTDSRARGIGDEFKTARDLLTRRLDGDAAFRNGRAA